MIGRRVVAGLVVTGGRYESLGVVIGKGTAGVE